MNIFSDWTTRHLYEFVYMLEREYANSNKDNLIKEVKKEIRKRNNKKSESDRRVINNYGNSLDGYILRIECPDYVHTKEDAEEWFHENEEMEYHWLPYDCTGQLFTSWYSLFNVNEKWICYHSVGIDI